MFGAYSVQLTVHENTSDGFAPIIKRDSILGAGNLPFKPGHTAGEAGGCVKNRNVTIEKALQLMRRMFLEDIETIIGNMATFTSSNE